MKLRTTPEPDASPATAVPATASSPTGSPSHCPSLFYLPSRYGTSLDANLARLDALYAFSESIASAASSENQLLNLIEKKVRKAIQQYQKTKSAEIGPTIEDLETYVTALDGLVESCGEVICRLEMEEQNDCPEPRVRMIKPSEMVSRDCFLGIIGTLCSVEKPPRSWLSEVSRLSRTTSHSKIRSVLWRSPGRMGTYPFLHSFFSL